MYCSTEKAENSYLAGPATRGADAAVDQMGLVSPAAKTAARKRTSSNGMLVTLRTRHVQVLVGVLRPSPRRQRRHECQRARPRALY